jgi:hypothetical protein
VKLRLHVYLCRKCGTGKVNAQDATGRWTPTWHRPDGTSIAASTTPPCEVGPKTAAALQKYAAAL